MEIITKKSLIGSVAEQYKQAYYTPGTDSWERVALSGMRLSRKARHELLKQATTEDEIEQIIGNRSWTSNKCDECRQDYEITVLVGETPDYESATAQLCLSCLEKATDIARVAISV